MEDTGIKSVQDEMPAEGGEFQPEQKSAAAENGQHGGGNGARSGRSGREEREKAGADRMDAMARQMAKSWTAVKNACRAWDFRAFDKALAAFSSAVADLAGNWPAVEPALREEMEENSRFVESKDYQQALEEALLAAGLPLQGSFPQYELIPYKLTIDSEDKEIRLSIGRRQEKTRCMEPKQAAKWVASRYQALTGKRFDAPGFMRELISAYEYANKVAYREGEVKWGLAVAIEELYNLLTLKRGARLEYPKALFLYELGRLKEQVELKVDEYQLEIGYPRKHEKAVTIVDSRGRESRVSSLTVYKVVDAGDNL